ncbi:MAG: UDP-N-acetylmuramate--L-alanine ligase [Bacteroidales bacterium]
MRTHFIAIGGSAMHNLALALHQKGHVITGSDDEIFEPAKSRLQAYGILPENIGWFPEQITPEINEIIVGMHARADNPELLRAKELGLKIYSYPEYLYQQSKDKKRIVVGGSHGKTSTTAMILHVLRYANIEADYMVGAQLEGFDTMVHLTNTAKIAVFEGDEYLTSPLDPRPKFHLYQPHIAIITGIAWDHVNVFPSWEEYVKQFSIFADLIEDGGTLIYCAKDKTCASVAEIAKSSLLKIPYTAHPSTNKDGICNLSTDVGDLPLKIFGEHNLENLTAAMYACEQVGVTRRTFYAAIASFAGASRRLQLMASNDNSSVFYDFAHSPSKLQATTDAVKQQFPKRKLYACMELHTFSSLSKDFLSQYAGTMQSADCAYVYFNPHTLQHKNLKAITEDEVLEGFGGNVKVFTHSADLLSALQELPSENTNYLLMSSGNFGGVDIQALAKKLVS